MNYRFNDKDIAVIVRALRVAITIYDRDAIRCREENKPQVFIDWNTNAADDARFLVSQLED